MKLLEVIEGMSETDYDNRPELRSSDFKDFIDKPVYFFRRHIAPEDWRLPKEPRNTPDFQFGRVLHSILEHGGDWQRFVAVEPKGFEEHKFDKKLLEAIGKKEIIKEPSDLVVGIDNARLKKAYKDWKKEVPGDAVIAPWDFDDGLYKKYKSFIGDTDGKEVIKAGKINRYREIVETLMRDQQMKNILDLDRPSHRELTLIWEHKTGIQCKSRLDYLSMFILDWKTIANIKNAVWDIGAYKYDISAAYYQIPASLFLDVDRFDVPMLWVFLEKSGGFSFRKIDAEKWMPHAHEQVDIHMRRLADMTDDDWLKIYSPKIEKPDPPANRNQVLYFEE